MTRPVIARILATGACALMWFGLVLAGDAAGQGRTTGAGNKAAAAAVPRMADGHPDLSGVWWGGGDIGAASGRGPLGRGGRGAAAPQTFPSLYTPEAAQRAKALGDKDDPTLRCVPTAF